MGISRLTAMQIQNTEREDLTVIPYEDTGTHKHGWCLHYLVDNNPKRLLVTANAVFANKEKAEEDAENFIKNIKAIDLNPPAP